MSERPTLMLLPGLLCDETVWEAQIAAFGRDWQIIVVDLRGYSSFDTMAEVVLERAPSRFALAGHSMGGRVALEVFRQAPDRVERLALLSTGVHPVLEGEADKRQQLIAFAWRDGMEALARQWIPPTLHPSHRQDHEMVEAMIAMWCRSTPEIHEGQIRAALDRRDARPLLPAIRCPTLVLGGADDPWAPASQQEEIAKAISGAELALIPECGHMVTMEQPEAVNARLRTWLAVTGDRP